MSNKNSTLVSIIMPTYNHGHFIGRALSSVIKQTYKNWELFVIDNFSDDNTQKVMSEFNDPRINYLRVNNFGVIATSRNIGIRKARGKWIAFLDSDDWWTNDKLEICLNFSNDDVDFIYHELEIKSNKYSLFHKSFRRSKQVKTPVLIDLLLNGNPISTSSVLVRSLLIRKINGMDENPKIIAAEDYRTWLQIAKITNKFKYISKTLGFYQMHNEAVSSNKDMSIPVKNTIYDFITILNPELKKKCMSNIYYTKGRYLYINKKYAKAKKLLVFSMRYGKFSIALKSLWMLQLIFFK